jgi:hypothetical protein
VPPLLLLVFRNPALVSRQASSSDVAGTTFEALGCRTMVIWLFSDSRTPKTVLFWELPGAGCALSKCRQSRQLRGPPDSWEGSAIYRVQGHPSTMPSSPLIFPLQVGITG